MPRSKSRWLASLVFFVSLVVPAGVRAEHGVPCDCNPGSYPKREYRFYYLSRLLEHHGPKISVYAPDRAPGIPIGYDVRRFHCPYATPQEIYQFPSTPAATAASPATKE
jgi:hypothetical protein